MQPEGWFLRQFAKLLPRDFRERVFEPALIDLRLDQGSIPPGALFWKQLVLVVECLRLCLPRLVWHRGRLTRPARVMLVVLVILTGLALLRQRAAYRWH